ncbi:alpha/beta hydrolase [Aliidiomarina sedimenti]|uniref:Alpha/beta hydrolase n=1 Tax=Aliidiomarina sedimenti TaxID=1933879 RepID=A0ABY0BVD9_9GAMM|nr:alpha/beta hydrolase-fold protein [Aliidiomarina sedimenti]RUO28150.1 alpha/beta hydrolase [Aliidiomarina sedimenti]
MIRFFAAAIGALVFVFSNVALADDKASFQVDSERLDESVTIRVALPESYLHSTDFAYPVLLVMDGSTQFEHIAGNVNFLSTFAEIPEMIVVGVSANNRLKNFTHTEIEQFAGRSGGAGRYTEFLLNELLPQLRDEYRVAPYTAVTGHSLSGLYTTYLALHHADEIQAVISVSPSLWWDDFAILSHVEQLQDERPASRWFASMASEPGEMAEGFARLTQQLDSLPTSDTEWELHQFPDETHDTTPLIGNVTGLRSIFNGFNAVPEIEVKSLPDLQRYYQQHAVTSGYNLPMGHQQYNVYGLKAAYEGQLPWGIAILQAGVEIFPRSEILWDSLATALRMNDQIPAALEASNKAVEFARAHDSKYLSEILLQNEALN